MINKVIRCKNRSKLLLVLVVSVTILSCKENNRKSNAERIIDTLTTEELNEISNNWKSDSNGCMKKRDPEKIKLLISQLKLVGKDSMLLFRHLGKPNSYELKEKINTYVYFMECYGKEKVSYHNLYCNVEQGKFKSYTIAIF